MAIAHVQTAFNSAATAVTSISVTLTLTAGNAVIVTVLTYFQATVLTQTAGDTLTQRIHTIPGGLLADQWDNLSVAGGSTTFTFTLDNASSLAAMFVTEVSGLNSSNAFDQSVIGTHNTATTHSTGTTAATTAPNEILIACLHLDAAGVTGGFSATNGFTIPTNGDQVGGGSNLKSGLAYNIVSATGTYETTLSVNDSSNGFAFMGTYSGPTLAAAGTGFVGPVFRSRMREW